MVHKLQVLRTNEIPPLAREHWVDCSHVFTVPHCQRSEDCLNFLRVIFDALSENTKNGHRYRLSLKRPLFLVELEDKGIDEECLPQRFSEYLAQVQMPTLSASTYLL